MAKFELFYGFKISCKSKMIYEWRCMPKTWYIQRNGFQRQPTLLWQLGTLHRSGELRANRRVHELICPLPPAHDKLYFMAQIVVYLCEHYMLRKICILLLLDEIFCKCKLNPVDRWYCWVSLFPYWFLACYICLFLREWCWSLLFWYWIHLFLLIVLSFFALCSLTLCC